MNKQNLVSVSTGEFMKTIKERGDVIILDVRTPQEFEKEHLYNSININYNSLRFEDFISKLNSNNFYAIYCRSGVRSRNALELMRNLGFKQVIDLSGGIDALKQEKNVKNILVS